MTNKEIDALEGRELDRAFGEAFKPRPLGFRGERLWECVDLVLAALPDRWGWRIGSCIKGDAKCYANVWPNPKNVVDVSNAEGPTPATALCRAALMAKAAEAKADSCQPSAAKLSGGTLDDLKWWRCIICGAMRIAFADCSTCDRGQRCNSEKLERPESAPSPEPLEAES